jgi:hypothetical protein
VILPTKYLPHERALLTIGGDILAQLEEPLTISELWERVRATRNTRDRAATLSFDWFILALSLLYAIAAIVYKDGVVRNEIRR